MIIKSLKDLQSIAVKVSDFLIEKDCIYLIGEIGVGKTTLARKIINYLQLKEKKRQTEVLSPTFNLLYEYSLNKTKIMHYDLYRIKNTKEVDQLGIFKESFKSIKIIEWPELIKDKVGDKLEIKLSHRKNENERNLELLGKGRWKDFKINEL